MAGAYGGAPIGSIRRPGVKYTSDRLEGSIKFRVEADNENQIRAQLSSLVKSGSKVDASLGSHQNLSQQDPVAPKMQSLMQESQQNSENPKR